MTEFGPAAVLTVRGEPSGSVGQSEGRAKYTCARNQNQKLTARLRASSFCTIHYEKRLKQSAG